MQPGTDLPIGFVGLRLAPQDPRALQQSVVRIRVNFRYKMSSMNIRQQFMS